MRGVAQAVESGRFGYHCLRFRLESRSLSCSEAVQYMFSRQSA
jgi:hypothetical protein